MCVVSTFTYSVKQHPHCVDVWIVEHVPDVHLEDLTWLHTSHRTKLGRFWARCRNAAVCAFDKESHQVSAQ